MKLYSTLLLILVTNVFCCDDDSIYSFGSFVSNGKQYNRTCAWITENPNETSKRRGEWCNRRIDNEVVKDACPMACLICPPTSTQSISSVSSERLNIMQPETLSRDKYTVLSSKFRSNRSLQPRCDADEFLGKTYFLEEPTSESSTTSPLCLKVDFFSGGVVDVINPPYTNCTEASIEASLITPTTISYFASASDEVITFEPGILGANGWTGTIHFVQGDSETGFEYLNTDNTIRVFIQYGVTEIQLCD